MRSIPSGARSGTDSAAAYRPISVILVTIEARRENYISIVGVNSHGPLRLVYYQLAVHLLLGIVFGWRTINRPTRLNSCPERLFNVTDDTPSALFPRIIEDILQKGCQFFRELSRADELGIGIGFECE